MITALRILAPYISVVLFWVYLENGWLAILAYHAQIIFWNRYTDKSLRYVGSIKRTWVLLLPAIITGVITYVTLPHLLPLKDLEVWLSDHKLSDTSLMLMIPYFGIIHPILEERHWRAITEKTVWGHVFFAAYHMIVLYTLLPAILVLVAFFALLAVSFLWHYMYKKEGNLLSPILFHILADLGMISAVYLLLFA